MGKGYIWYICLASLFCFSFSRIGQPVTSNAEHGVYYENKDRSYDEGNGVYSDGLQSAGSGSGWTGHGHDAGYSSVSQFASCLSDNRNTGSQAKETNSKKGETAKLTIYSRTPQPRISKYISYQEAVYSPQAAANKIPNIPLEKHLIVMRNLGITFFDPLREHFKTPIYINSFFRSKELNAKVGGTIYSDHLCERGIAAIDIDMDGHKGPTNNQLFHYILGNHRFYKMIAEFPVKGKPKWIHVAISTNEVQNGERNVYIAQLVGKRKIYTPYKGNERLISR